ncbi:MAG: hypothetical protein ABI629_12535 [bacterium]
MHRRRDALDVRSRLAHQHWDFRLVTFGDRPHPTQAARYARCGTARQSTKRQPRRDDERQHCEPTDDDERAAEAEWLGEQRRKKTAEPPTGERDRAPRRRRRGEAKQHGDAEEQNTGRDQARDGNLSRRVAEK